MKLLQLSHRIQRPLAENLSVVNTFASDGDRYFQFPLSDKWRRKIVRLQPEDGVVSVIDLPHEIDMMYAQIY